MADERTGVLEAVVDHGHDTRTLVVRPAAPLTFRPGQFLSCLLPIGGERLIRPYSIASAPETPERLELLLNRVPEGPGSDHLFGLAPGDTLSFTGPWGTFALDRAPDAPAVFVALGTGIAPIRPMLHRAAATARHPLSLLYATDHVLYRDELDAVPGLAWDTVAPDAVTSAVTRRWVEGDQDRSRHFFLCGVGDVVLRLRDLLRGAGYVRRAVQYERW